MTPAGLDLLELELRRLPGVGFVGYVARDDALIVQILAGANADRIALRERAAEIARHHVDNPVVVEVVGEKRASRVKVLGVDVDDGGVRIQLAHDDRTAMGQGDASTPFGVAAATVDALSGLGAEVPFEIEHAALFEHEDCEGVMVVLARAGSTGSLYGAAAAESMQQAAVRATLHALNRHLATSAFLLRPRRQV